MAPTWVPAVAARTDSDNTPAGTWTRPSPRSHRPPETIHHIEGQPIPRTLDAIAHL